MPLAASNSAKGSQVVKLGDQLDAKSTHAISLAVNFPVGVGTTSITIDRAQIECLTFLSMQRLMATASANAHRQYQRGWLKPHPWVKAALVTAEFESLIPIVSH